ncbi:MAG TPA: HEAT repeat domain-containing protein [Candidatus Aminicenantes bacterium]|nr:HEAT repeat domain-containing protein [Candidatus Aminicenantes bacterium]
MDPEDFKAQKNAAEQQKPQAEEEKPKADQQKPELEKEKPEQDQEKPEQVQQKPQPEQQKPQAAQQKSTVAEKKPEPEEEKPKVNPLELKKAGNVIQFFKKAFSLIKLYPPENPSVAKSVDLFSNQMGEFLNEYEELAIEVGEFSFSYKGEIVFQGEERSKSLPFLFHKDGLRELSFHKGLDKGELHEFFRVISEVADLPAEDADIVNSIWEKNFVYIRYYSLDEFLEQDIGEPAEEIGIFDKMGFGKGKVELTLDDDELFKKSLSLGIEEGREKGEGEGEGDVDGEGAGAGIMAGTTVGAISKDEIPEIGYMISESRKTPHMAELISLVFELLFCEEKDEQFAAVSDVLAECHQTVLEESDFSMALSILKRIDELKEIISAKSEERAKLLGRISDNAKAPDSIDNLKKIYSGGRVTDFDTFFGYLDNLAVSAFPVVAAIWEDSRFPFSRQKALNFLKKMGKEDLNSFLSLARDRSASLTREIISILATISEKTEIAHLEDFVNHPDKAIRLDVIQALGKSGDEASNKILLRFLSDKDAEIRTAALRNLKYLKDDATLDHVKQMAHVKDFREKSKREKEAILKFLASSKSREISAFLRSILKKGKIFFPYKTNETRLCAVSALGVMATIEAADILKLGTKIRNKAIRTACKYALVNIASEEKLEEDTRKEPKEETKEEPKEDSNEEQGA